VAVNGSRKPRKGDTELILALAQGKSIREAAAIAGVGETTVYRRRQDPAFRREVSELRMDMYREAAGLLARSMVPAVGTLLSLQKAESEMARLGAARTLLEFGMRISEAIDLAERIAALEERLGGVSHGDLYSKN
jgi:transposase